MPPESRAVIAGWSSWLEEGGLGVREHWGQRDRASSWRATSPLCLHPAAGPEGLPSSLALGGGCLLWEAPCLAAKTMRTAPGLGQSRALPSLPIRVAGL